MTQEETFKLQRIAATVFVSGGLIMSPERIVIEGSKVILDILTQEDEVFDYPADWWQAFKERWFTKWLKRRSRVKRARVWAIHKFPELDFPQNFVGKEFVHLKVLPKK